MYIRTEDVETLGFKPFDMFRKRVHHFYYAEFSEYKKVFIIDNIDQTVSHFALTPKEWDDYKSDKLSLVPIGCCSVSGRQYKDNPSIDFKGDWRHIFKTRTKVVEHIHRIIHKDSKKC